MMGEMTRFSWVEGTGLEAMFRRMEARILTGAANVPTSVDTSHDEAEGQVEEGDPKRTRRPVETPGARASGVARQTRD